jgi:hypothetical protein
MINSDSDPESLLVSDSKLGLLISDSESMNPDLNLAFLQVLEPQSMNPDPDLESMINSNSDPESLLVLDSKLGLSIPADLGLGIHHPRFELGIPAGLRVAIHEPRHRLGIHGQLRPGPGIPASLGLKIQTQHPC